MIVTQLRFLAHMLWGTYFTYKNLWVIPARANSTRSSSNKLYGLRPEFNRSQNQRTGGGIWRRPGVNFMVACVDPQPPD